MDSSSERLESSWSLSRFERRLLVDDELILEKLECELLVHVQVDDDNDVVDS
jgi:hypothetical protein